MVGPGSDDFRREWAGLKIERAMVEILASLANNHRLEFKSI